MKLYDTLYYTFYRALLRLDEMYSTERETPRVETALILSILTGLNVVTVLALFTKFFHTPIFSGKKISDMLMTSPIIFINLALVFYKRRYRTIEDKFLESWNVTRNRNILITASYVIFTIVFFCLTIQFIKITR